MEDVSKDVVYSVQNTVKMQFAAIFVIEFSKSRQVQWSIIRQVPVSQSKPVLFQFGN